MTFLTHPVVSLLLMPFTMIKGGTGCRGIFDLTCSAVVLAFGILTKVKIPQAGGPEVWLCCWNWEEAANCGLSLAYGALGVAFCSLNFHLPMSSAKSEELRGL